jgi:hypothetical protein
MPALNYNANDERIRFLFRWRHTVLPMVVRDPVFWLLQGLHCFMLSTERKLIEEGRGGELPFLDWRAAMVTTSLLTFFVVFYTSSCYDRYQNLFDKCIGIGGCVAEWAYLIRAHFDQVSPAVKWNLLRLILGAQQIHYAYLGGDEVRSSALTFSPPYARSCQLALSALRSPSPHVTTAATAAATAAAVVARPPPPPLRTSRMGSPSRLTI